MVKRSIQTSRPGHTVGVEYDHLAIRAARLSTDGRGGFAVEKLEELRGDFSEDVSLLEGLRKIREKLSTGMKDAVVACLAGKQVYASQMPFRRLGQEEMEQALRLELRKTVHFEVATSTLDFELLSDDDGSNGGEAQILVALAANSLLNRNLSLLERAGLKPAFIDVLPVAIANALWTWKGNKEGDYPLVALHVGPQVSTIVIDGESSPFFNRNIYFAAEDMFRPDASPGDRDKRIQSLVDEVARSLVFYEKNSQVTGFREVLLLGDYLDGATLTDPLQLKTGLPIRKMDLPKQLGSVRESDPGKFDLAVALALRGEL
jgi:Tfp pilus assembly PilM family ATPase